MQIQGNFLLLFDNKQDKKSQVQKKLELLKFDDTKHDLALGFFFNQLKT